MGLVALALMIVLARRRRVISVPKQVEASRLLRRFERLMEKRGHEPRPLHQPHKLYFAKVGAEDPPVAMVTDQFAHAYLHARFSGEVTDEDVMTMRALLEQLSKLKKPIPKKPANNDVSASAG